MKYFMSLVLILLSGSMLIPNGDATVEPSVAQLVNQSEVILVGQIVSVAGDDKSLLVELQVRSVFKGAITRVTSTLHFDYVKSGKGDIDFRAYLRADKEFIFYFNKTKRGVLDVLTLSDSWFGVQGYTPALEKQIRQLVEVH